MEIRVAYIITGLVILLSVLEIRNPLLCGISSRTLVPWSALIPVPTLWTIWSSSFAEMHLWKVFVSAPIVFVCTTLLEALWSFREILQYIAFSTGVAGLTVLVTYYLLFAVLGIESIFHPVSGCGGLVVTLIVSVRHAFPYKELLNLNRVTPSVLQDCLPARGFVQARHMPFVCITSISVLGFLFPSIYPDAILAVISYMSSWFYIRYLMHFPYANVRGDHSNEFTFSLLFPKLFRPWMDRISQLVYTVANRLAGDRFALRVSDKVSLAVASTLYSPNDAAAASSVIEALASGTAEERSKFEERRQKALRFLDDNIAALIGSKSSDDPNEVGIRLVETQHAIGGMSQEEIAEV